MEAAAVSIFWNNISKTETNRFLHNPKADLTPYIASQSRRLQISYRIKYVNVWDKMGAFA